MKDATLFTRRGAIKTCLGTVAALTAADIKAYAATFKKRPGETKVVYLGGDQLHNGFTQEFSLRFNFRDTGWRFISTTDARLVTPALIEDADLLIITRWGGPIFPWHTGDIVESRDSLFERTDGYMSAELEDAIVSNVKDRGMGFMALHCTCWSPDFKKFTGLMGIEAIMHGPVQTVHMHDFNQNHPITERIDNFDMPLDENFGVKLVNPKAVKLYETTGEKDNRHDIAGWCIEQGNGRVVGLPAGHTNTAWTNPTYMELHWRAAHWAMHRDIPPFVKYPKAWF